MSTKLDRSPTQVADDLEMLAQAETDDGDREAARLYMEPAHALRRVLKTLDRLQKRVHTGYDFNRDPDNLTLEVSQVLEGYKPPHT